MATNQPSSQLTGQIEDQVEAVARHLAEKRWKTWLVATPPAWDHVTERERESWREDAREVLAAARGAVSS